MAKLAAIVHSQLCVMCRQGMYGYENDICAGSVGCSPPPAALRAWVTATPWGARGHDGALPQALPKGHCPFGNPLFVW